jgi:hypothetical protein
MAIVDTVSVPGGTQGLQQLGYLFGSEVLGGRAREEQRLQDLIRQLTAQPQTTLAPQQQLGPVIQAPSIEIPGVNAPWPEAPAAPSLASNMFAPSRATWGNEALFPQGGATGGPYGLTEADVTAGGPLVAGLREYERRFMTPQTTDTPGLERWLAMQPSPPPEVVGGATAYPPPAERPVPPPLPYTAAPFRPGGERLTEVQPGKSFAEILTQRPELTQTFIRSYPLLQAIKAEESERQAQRDWARAFGAAPAAAGGPGLLVSAAGGAAPAPAGAEDPQLAAIRTMRAQLEPIVQRITGTPLATTERGKAMINQYQELLAAEDKAEQRVLERTKGAREARKAEREEVQAKQAQQFVNDEAARLEATGDPANVQLARTLRAAGADPHLATVMQKHYEQEQKRTELDKPILIEGQPYRVVRNAAGEPVMQALPGVPQKAEKPWYEGITRAEAEAMAEDATLPPERRRQARQLATALQTGAEKVAAASAPPKPTQESEKQAGERVVLSRALDQVAQMAMANPDWIGGSAKPLTAGKYAAAYDAWDPLKGVAALLANVPPGYDTFRANLGMFTAEKLNELAGAALTPNEIKRYAAFLPSVWQSPERFMASIQVSREMLIGASKYYEARQSGKSIPEAQAIARDAIEAAYQEGIKQYGAPTLTPPKTAAEFKSRKGGSP